MEARTVVIENEEETLQGFIISDHQGDILFIPNCTIVLTIETYLDIHHGFDIITSKI